MPETLQVTREDIRIAIGREFGLGEDPDNEWNSTDVRRSEDWIKKGLSAFYTPAPLAEEKAAHVWSFLFPTHYQGLSENVSSYLLPEDFGGMQTNEAWYSEVDEVWHSLKLVNLPMIDRSRSQVLVSMSGAPTMAYIGPVKSDGTLGQRNALEVWPTPAGPYTVKFQYYSNPFQIAEDTPYPLGGQASADAILEACLAAAEITLRPESQLHRSEFQTRLRAAIAHDRQHIQQIRNLGKYGDRGQDQILRYRTRGYVLYEGVDYSNR